MFVTKLMVALVCGLWLIGCQSTYKQQAVKDSLDSVSSVSAKSLQSQTIKVRLYFGLSIPSGGLVTAKQWQAFVDEVITQQFKGFNIVDSTGYYLGKPEPSKIVTIIIPEADLPKAQTVAASYASRFKQDSVMLVKLPVLDWQFVTAPSR
ncbi:DUF3574 domain-containing protein [Saccharobesus litoralis]|uniref:DUF3574 domain-containing protein n=1 Tax=Saccharobesus litoralis TaxID=2172099 RepID=A0A2S0VRU3_9ALTE|nr:DUF3574 domain-containing protein [Saccharobesus litoralis]AWB66820.1 DUF3574 domain-containing protein [Saccharobesus litoralis]